MTRPAGRPGFTLIEMLVVMAIIALLIALLLPTVKRSKDHAKAVLCQSNLRQFTYAMRAYSDEQKQYMPMPIHKDPGCCWNDAWYQTLDPYLSFYMDYNNVSKPKTMACPAADEITSTIPELWGYHLNPNVTGYDDDPDGSGPRQFDPTDIYVKRDLITHQSKTPFMFDASGDLVIGRNPYESWYGGFPPGSSNDFKFRHPNGIGHIAMIDAHVEGIRGTHTSEHSSIDGYDEPEVPAELYSNGPPIYWHYLYRPYDLF